MILEYYNKIIIGFEQFTWGGEAPLRPPTTPPHPPHPTPKKKEKMKKYVRRK